MARARGSLGVYAAVVAFGVVLSGSGAARATFSVAGVDQEEGFVGTAAASCLITASGPETSLFRMLHMSVPGEIAMNSQFFFRRFRSDWLINQHVNSGSLAPACDAVFAEDPTYDARFIANLLDEDGVPQDETCGRAVFNPVSFACQSGAPKDTTAERVLDCVLCPPPLETPAVCAQCPSGASAEACQRCDCDFQWQNSLAGFTKQFGLVTMDGSAAALIGGPGVASIKNAAAGVVTLPGAQISSFAYSVQGNTLSHSDVLDRMEQAFVAEGCDLPERLMRSIEAGSGRGVSGVPDSGQVMGDVRCVGIGEGAADRAYIAVDAPDQEFMSVHEPVQDRYLYINVLPGDVPDGSDPITELRRRFDEWRETHPCPAAPEPDVPSPLKAGDMVAIPIMTLGSIDLRILKPDSGGSVSAGTISEDGAIYATDVAIDRAKHVLVGVSELLAPGAPSRIDRVHPGTFAVETLFDTGTFPELAGLNEIEFALEPDGNILFGGKGSGPTASLYRFDEATGGVAEVTSLSDTDIIEDVVRVSQRDEALVVAQSAQDHFVHRLIRVDLTGVQPNATVFEGAFRHAAVSHDGSEAYTIGKAVDKVNLTTNAVNGIIDDDWSFESVRGVDLDPEGNIVLLTTMHSSSVLVIDPATGAQTVSPPLPAAYLHAGLAVVGSKCSDGFDNDNDGAIDFGGDADCKSSSRNREKPGPIICSVNSPGYPSGGSFPWLVALLLGAAIAARRSRGTLVALAAVACLGSQAPACGPVVIMDPSLSSGFFSMPWPNDTRLMEDGSLDTTNFPGTVDYNPFTGFLVEQGRKHTVGFGTNSAVYFQLSAPIDVTSLPTAEQSVQADSSVMLVNLDDPTAPRVPLLLDFKADETPYRPSNLLSLLPYPGHPLKERTRYAALVLSGLRDDAEEPLRRAPLIDALDVPWTAEVPTTQEKWEALQEQRAAVFSYVSNHTAHAPDDVVTFTVFTTQDVTSEMKAIFAAIEELPPPVPKDRSEGRCLSFSSRTVLGGTLELPKWQAGVAPFDIKGGAIVVEGGKAVQQSTEEVYFQVAVPCGEPPADGWPILLFMDGTGAEAHATEIYELGGARLPYIVASIAPLYSGDRSLPGIDGGFQFFNPLNTLAGRTNQLQQAADMIYLRRMVENLSLSPTETRTAEPVKIDGETVVIAGHSQGSITIPIALAVDDSFDAAFMSMGAGGLYHALLHNNGNRVQLSGFLGMPLDEMDMFHPLVNIFQTIAEVGDASNYAAQPHTAHVLMTGGLKDGCSPYETILHTAEAFGFPLANGTYGPRFGAAIFEPESVALPATGNLPGGRTGVMVQLDTGHYGASSNEELGHTFVTSLVTDGVPTVLDLDFASDTAPGCDGRYQDLP